MRKKTITFLSIIVKKSYSYIFFSLDFTPSAYGYTHNNLVALSPSQGRIIGLNPQGQPPQGNGTVAGVNLKRVR